MSESAELRRHAAERLVACVRRLRSRGWCEATSGNYSVTIDREPLRLLITPSGRDKGTLRPEELLLVDGDGRPLGPEPGRPSAETRVHLVLAGRAGAGTVLHTHSMWATLVGERSLAEGRVTLHGYEMLKGLEGVRSHEDRVVVPVLRNTQDMVALAGEVERVVARRPAIPGFLIAGHGLYAWGADVDQAYRHVETFEFLFELVARRASLDPPRA